MASLLEMLFGQGQQQPGRPMDLSPPLPQGDPMTGLFGGAVPQQMQQAQAPQQQAPSSGGPDFGNILSTLGTSLMLASGDPNYMKVGLHQSEQQDKNRKTSQQQNQTLQWLSGKGVDTATASYLASDPAAFRAWFGEFQKGQKPNWEVVDLSDGKYMIDKNDPTGQRKQRIDTPQPPITGPDGKPVVVPPGQDPKAYREAVSKRGAEEIMPASPEVVSGLRKEVQSLPSYKNITQAAPVYKSMLDAAGRDNRAADVNLIYGMAKIMDPTSVVRESEMTVAQAVATLPQQLQAAVKSQIESTGRLSPEVRAAIMQEARSRIQAYQGMFDQDAQMYRGIAQRGRMNEADVLPSFGPFDEFKAPTAPAAPAAPAAKTTKSGIKWSVQ